MNSSIDKIFREIRAEREYQDARWGTDFDDKNTLDNWIRYIVSYSGRAADTTVVPSQQRRDMMKVAALAVAACEAFDRNNGFPPRHYEDIVAKEE